jgi:adenine-specific DNA-methyltransferase
VLDPTCGSGTTAYVAEQWGRRWITIDTSRVALALARARIMGARYPFYLLADSREGQLKEAEVTRTAPEFAARARQHPPRLRLRARAAHHPQVHRQQRRDRRHLGEVAGEAGAAARKLNAALGKQWEEWEIPREADAKWPMKPSKSAKKLHADWWQQRIARQKEIDASIAAKAEFEYLYDKPYEDKKKVRVAGPFTVESLSPHRVLGVDENDELIDPEGRRTSSAGYGAKQDFPQMILENLKTAGVQQAHKEDKITFTPHPLARRPGLRRRPLLEGSGTEKRAAIFIGPEFGTVPPRPGRRRPRGRRRRLRRAHRLRLQLRRPRHRVHKLGRIPVLKARMNADLHMADDLKNTGKGNLFVIFGEPDIDISGREKDGQIQVKVNGVDVFHPNTGEVRSDGADGIACWFIDTDYNEESFFVRHAYFLGANDPYKALKTTLKAEINEEAWATLNSDTSRPFDKPEVGPHRREGDQPPGG